MDTRLRHDQAVKRITRPGGVNARLDYGSEGGVVFLESDGAAQPRKDRPPALGYSTDPEKVLELEGNGGRNAEVVALK